MKKIFSLLLFYILASISFSADCDTQFTDELSIRALDVSNRPLPNASITVYYQLSSSTGKGYTTTTPKLTASNGTIYIKIQNLEKQEEHLDCDIVITAEYGGKSAEKTVTANSHPTIVDLKLDVYTLVVIVEDQDGNAIEGALVSVDGFESHTNEYGRALLRIGTGEKTLFVSYNGAEREEEITIEEDSEYEVSFYISGLTINVVDDNGNPLEAQLSVYGETYQAEQGTAIIPNIGSASPEVLVEYNGIEKYPEIDLNREDEYTVIFDFTPPVISSIKENHSEGILKLSIIIEDPGAYPSGVDASSLTVRYTIGEEWKNAKVYSKGGNLYVAELESIPVNSILSFEIYVEDNDGNSVSLPGQFSIFETPVNGNQTDGENGDGGEDKGEFDLSSLCINAVGLIIIVGLIYFIYKKYVKKEE